MPPLTYKARHFCLVCGEPGKQTGCCGDPLCRAVLTIHPDLKDGTGVRVCRKASDSKHDTHKRNVKRRREKRKEKRRTDVIRQGLRSAGIEPLGAQDGITVIPNPREDYRRLGEQPSSPWSGISPRYCLFRSEASKEGETGLRLVVAKSRNIREQIVSNLGGEAYLREYDYILAWRCGCSAGSEVYLKDPKQIPNAEGRYGVCPLCNACALSVEVRKD